MSPGWEAGPGHLHKESVISTSVGGLQRCFGGILGQKHAFCARAPGMPIRCDIWGGVANDLHNVCGLGRPSSWAASRGVEPAPARAFSASLNPGAILFHTHSHTTVRQGSVPPEKRSQGSSRASDWLGFPQLILSQALPLLLEPLSQHPILTRPTHALVGHSGDGILNHSSLKIRAKILLHGLIKENHDRRGDRYRFSPEAFASFPR